MPLPSVYSPTSSSSGGRLVSSEGRELPLRGASLRAEVGGGIARVVLTQRFVNPHAEALTVSYILPLPSDGAVSGYAFELGDRRIVGTIDRKHSARARFEQALVEGRSAALLEQARTSVFDQRIGNIPPGAEIVAEVTIDQPLAWLEEGANEGARGGSWEWRFPTVVAPRYMGAPGRVADAAQLEVPVADAALRSAVSLELTIADALMGAPESPSHALTIAEADIHGHTRLSFAVDAGVALDRDVVVRWPVAQPKVGVSVLAARADADELDGDTFALLTLVPPRRRAGARSVPRDLLFLLDTSGSMGGRPLQQAKRVVGAMIDTLGPEDRLELIEFGSAPRRFRGQPLAATERNKAAAQTWLSQLQARGGTQMHDAVLEALAPLRDDAQRQIILVTDGHIGFEREIVEALIERLPAGVRLHTVGVGSSINRSLTEDAARAGRGTELIVGLDEDVERVLPRLLARTSAPLVTDLRVEGGAGSGEARLAEAQPFALPDLYAGAPALVPVRVRGAGELRVSGRVAGGRFMQRVVIPTLAPGEGPAQVVSLFGRELVADTELRVAAARGRAPELDANIEAWGLAFGIATRMTSWIAVSAQRTVDPRGPSRSVTQPHELPHGSSIEALGLRQPVPVGPFAHGGVAAAAPMDGGAIALGDPMVQTGSFAAPSPLRAAGAPSFGERRERDLDEMVLSADMPRQRRSTIPVLIVLLLIALLVAALVWARCGGTEEGTVESDAQGQHPGSAPVEGALGGSERR